MKSALAILGTLFFLALIAQRLAASLEVYELSPLDPPFTGCVPAQASGMASGNGTCDYVEDFEECWESGFEPCHGEFEEGVYPGVCEDNTSWEVVTCRTKLGNNDPIILFVNTSAFTKACEPPYIYGVGSDVNYVCRCGSTLVLPIIDMAELVNSCDEIPRP